MKKTTLIFSSLVCIFNSSFAQNVGIGTNTPAYKLDVKNGSINTDSLYRISSFPVLATPGTGNLLVGRQAGLVNTGTYNTFVGHLSGMANTTGSFNTFFGGATGIFNSTGASNAYFGTSAGYANNGSDNCFFGRESGTNTTTGSGNCFFGRSTGFLNNTGSDNSFIGYQAGYSNVSSFNCFVGFQAGYSNTFGNSNVFLGPECAYSNTDGWGSTMVGYRAGYNNTTGQGNCYFGYRAGFTNVDAKDNSFFGVDAGISSTGEFNTFIGHTAGENNTSGYENTFLGEATGGNTTGFRNVLLGANAATQSPNLTIATAVGFHALVGCSNCMALGGTVANGQQTRVGINNPIPLTDLHIIQQTDASLDKVRGIRLQRSVNTNHWRTMIDPSNNYIFEYNDNLYSYIEPVGGAFVNPSDERLKKDITPLPGVLDKLLLLQPKTYQYIATSDAGRTSYGFLAQDVEKLFPEFVFSNENGIKGIAYSNFSVIAIKAIQEQQQRIDQQQQQIDEMLKELSYLRKKIEQ